MKLIVKVIGVYFLSQSFLLAAKLNSELEFPSFIPDHSYTERILKDNRFFVEFINVSISNFGTKAQEKILLDAARLQAMAKKKSLRSAFIECFFDIRKSQKLMVKLYQKVLKEKYLTDTKRILDNSAPTIIYSKDKRATLLLKLGYREYEVARQKLISGKHQAEFLFSQKLHFFVKAIKMARTAKRMAFLALIEANTPYSEKEEYKLQTLNEYLHPNKTKKYPMDYLRVKHMLMSMISRKLIVNTDRYIFHHNDNFGYILNDNLLNKLDYSFLVEKN